ncbi:hypothetical protein WJX72_001613 [[Myrmecia] bisecta]|uniref:SAM-dependent methyltransferase n=1 Tax=[Myrmecia] bisecta TaxID=41462 RepID=A0AAW1P394_9CHLO
MASITDLEAVKATQANKAMWDRIGPTYDAWAVSGGLFKPISLVSQAAVSEAVQHIDEPVVLDVASASGEPAFTIAVLKPGGTVVLAVWASQVTLLDIFTELRNRIAPDAPPLPFTSDPRRFGNASPLLASMGAAGLTDIKQQEHEIPLRMTPNNFADFALQFGPLGGYLASLPDSEAQAKTARARKLCLELMHEHGTECADGTIALPKNMYTIITARKPV